MSADLFEADQKRKRLTADITHDLSTPLQIVSGYIEMLEGQEVTLSPERIDVIKTEIEHLRRLVGDMTTLTQAESGGLEMQLQPIKPVNLLDYIQRIYEPIARQKSVELELIVGEKLPLINIDEGRMVQVLKNLMDNALRHTPTGGSIRLSGEMTDEVSIRVRDSGEGIEAEDLPLVIAQGGTIAVESTGKGMGTTFVIRFPPARD